MEPELIDPERDNKKTDAGQKRCVRCSGEYGADGVECRQESEEIIQSSTGQARVVAVRPYCAQAGHYI